MIDFIKSAAREVQIVTSHCDGAFVLAKAGLPDGVVCTTFPSGREKMRQMFPRADVRDSVLFVHNGKFISSAGGAQSFEAALCLCEYLYGAEVARRLVIDWKLEKVPHLVVKQARKCVKFYRNYRFAPKNKANCRKSNQPWPGNLSPS